MSAIPFSSFVLDHEKSPTTDQPKSWSREASLPRRPPPAAGVLLGTLAADADGMQVRVVQFER
jgi:hypothetical protein